MMMNDTVGKHLFNNTFILSGIYLLKFNNGNIKTMCEICSKLPIKILETSVTLFWWLTLNRFHTLYWDYHFWLWTRNYRNECLMPICRFKQELSEMLYLQSPSGMGVPVGGVVKRPFVSRSKLVIYFIKIIYTNLFFWIYVLYYWH